MEKTKEILQREKNRLKRVMTRSPLITVRNMVKRVNDVFRPPQKWETHFSSLIKRDILPYLNSHNPEQHPRLLLWTPQALWPSMLMEYCIATTLRLQNWNVLVAGCDGYLPFCRQVRITFPKPPCSWCWNRSKTFVRAFHLPMTKFSDFVSKRELRDITSRLAKKNYQELIDIREDDYEVGNFAKLFINVYYHGTVEDFGEKEINTLRTIIAGTLLYYRYAKRCLEHYTPDMVLMLAGNSAQVHPGFHVFSKNNIKIVTWSEFGISPDCFNFAYNDYVVHEEIGKALWEHIAATPLSDAEEAELEGLITGFADGTKSIVNYNENSETKTDALIQRFSLDCSRRTFIIYTNVVWDLADVDRNCGFKDMMGWVYTLIDWFAEHHNTHQLIVRTHPGEVKLPEQLQTTSKVTDLIRKKYHDELPDNIIIIEPHDNANSYVLAALADSIGVYITSLGYELAARGRKVWVAGRVHYRNKGFTVDIEDKEHLIALLESDDWDSTLSPEEHVLARRYFYFRHTKKGIRVPFLSRDPSSSVYYDKPFFEHLKFLHPNQKNTIISIVTKILHDQPVTDIPASPPEELGSYVLRRD